MHRARYLMDGVCAGETAHQENLTGPLMQHEGRVKHHLGDLNSARRGAALVSTRSAAAAAGPRSRCRAGPRVQSAVLQLHLSDLSLAVLEAAGAEDTNSMLGVLNDSQRAGRQRVAADVHLHRDVRDWSRRRGRAARRPPPPRRT
jgi:hypothetical protein